MDSIGKIAMYLHTTNDISASAHFFVACSFWKLGDEQMMQVTKKHFMLKSCSATMSSCGLIQL
jgi:hypothetical protein